MNPFTNILLPKQTFDTHESLYVAATGYYEQPPNHKIQRRLDELENEGIIIYCFKGEGWLSTDAFTKIVSPGSFLFCDKGVAHAYGANPKNPWVIYWAHFGGLFLNYFSEQIGLENQVDVRSFTNRREIEAYMKQVILNLSNNPNQLRRLTSYTNLKLALLSVLPNDNLSYALSKDVQQGDQAIQFMNAHLLDRLTLEDIASHCNMSKYHFARTFKNQTGFSPISFYNQLKMEHAITVLLTTGETISEISRGLGFDTPYYFSQVFKQHTGFSPRAYRSFHKNCY